MGVSLIIYKVSSDIKFTGSDVEIVRDGLKHWIKGVCGVDQGFAL